MRQVILTRNPEGGFTAEIPSLPGCISEGETREEALVNIQEAASLWIEVVREHGEPIPPEDEAVVEVVDLKLKAA